ncbi:MAG: chitobiase/beta-hexosaminidase C-terminal domain-containing protein [Planctomycetes bacterium]|nr:chitobiase/beta-hexosaminidase C-terminal domain-containing protein [Planctomycetota bacterium]
MRWITVVLACLGLVGPITAGECGPGAGIALLPPSGTYGTVVPVVPVTRLATGERLVHTVDGSAPTAASWPVTGPILVTDPTQVQVAVVSAAGSVVRQASGTYDVGGILVPARPLATPAAGTYAAPIAVALSCATPGAAIRYTLDGSEPTERSPRYVAPIQVASTTTVYARAFGGTVTVRVWRFQVRLPAVFPSGVLAARYVIQGQTQQVATPVITPAGGLYRAEFPATATTATPDAVLRYRLDGTDPSSDDPQLPGAGVAIAASATLRVRGFRDGWTPSAPASATYQLQVPEPAVTPTSQTAHAAFAATVAIPPGSTVRYTLDGTAPTADSPVVTGPLAITRSTRLTMQAVRAGWDPSGIVTTVWTLQPELPTASLPAGAYTGPQQVILACATPDVAIRYTLDGTVPTAASPAATGAIPLPGSCELRAVAMCDDWADSPVMRADYVLTVAAPVLDLAAGSFASVQQVQVQVQAGAQARFTRDGTDPMTSATAADVSGPIAIDRTQTLTVRSWAAGWTDSAPTQATYVLGLPALTLTPATGTYAAPLQVTAALPAGATGRYTTDGSLPTSSSLVWPDTGLPVAQATALRVIAVRDGWSSSPVAEATYQFQASVPVADVAAGPWSQEQDVTLGSSVPGAVIRYTLDDSDPTQAGALTATGPIHLDHSLSLRAVTTAPGWLTSAPLAVDYVFQVATPVLTPAAGSVIGTVTVQATSATPGASIHATTDGSDPTDASPALPITLTRSATIRAQATRAGWTPSAIASGSWTVTPTVGFTTASLVVSVSAGAVPVAIRLSDAAAQDVAVTLQPIDGTAVFGTDLILSATTAVIPAGQHEGVVTLQAQSGAPDRLTVRASMRLAVATGAVVHADAAQVAITIPGIADPPPTFTERRSPLWRQPKESFDAVRWAEDFAYRTAYTSVHVPERVWESGVPPNAVTPLRIEGSGRVTSTTGSVAHVRVIGTPGMVINWIVDRPDIARIGVDSAGTARCSEVGVCELACDILQLGVARVRLASPAVPAVVCMVIEGVSP